MKAIIVFAFLLSIEPVAAELNSQESPQRGVSSSQATPSGRNSNSPIALTATQCDRLRNKVAQDSSLQAAYAEQIQWCDTNVRATPSSRGVKSGKTP